ncbi:Nuclear pore complex protein Nup205 [Talaromyces islandicus]|uniref:Nuclear pore complex protein Nup205 n=1 Tax=Talaromyces islandicus TaxID=28573 RepID=A0A0U1M340_TALIS|nr:Nuclear pore complex protein Nup205 [Talaromyces islandicus]
MSSKTEGIPELCWEVLPWISNQAISLGLETQDNRFAQLGCELFVFNQQLSSTGQTGFNSKVIKITELVNKACSVAVDNNLREYTPLAALWRIYECKNSNKSAGKLLVRDIRRSLRRFVQKNPEYPSLMRFISDYLHAIDPVDAQVDEQILSDTDTKYLTQIFNTLYTQLRIYSSCSCSTQHLQNAWLRLDLERDSQDNTGVPFELAFAVGPGYCTTSDKFRWKQAKISVARRNEIPQKKEVSFTAQPSNSSLRTQRISPLTEDLRKVEVDEFCRLIGSETNKQLSFHIHNNTLKLDNTVQRNLLRDFLPEAGMPLAQWLEQTVHLSDRVKVTLAYTIARSVWQYYNSFWMVKPWTHDNIQILKEKPNNMSHAKPHPYFTTKLQHYKGEIQDYCIADDLFHIYPNILALGVVLVEIAAKEPFRPDGPYHLWNETTINDYYEWAWRTANRSDLGNTIGAAYKAAVNNCLDTELFQDSSFDPPNFEKDLEMRQSLLYEKVVLPLRQLYLAYKDDWEIQENPTAEPIISSKGHTNDSRPKNRSEFTVAIFCALPLEADAVRDLFEEGWGEGENYGKAAGDANTYTLGRILHHNVVLVHLGGMGKGAASRASSSILSSYPEIKLGLVVGVCGGVPSYSGCEDDLILGDVIISDGIVQYDFGRQFPDTFSAREGVVSRPPLSIRTMLAKLKGVHVQKRVEKTISQSLKTLQNKPTFKKGRYPGIDKDELYQSTYQHKHQQPTECKICGVSEEGGADRVCEEARTMTCQQLRCQKDFLVSRRRLQEASAKGCVPNPKIHIGPIGSGDTAMNSGQHRDGISAQHNLIAFEMEGLGVWDTLPCLVIKGVCGYADSHKNKDWQHYAAVTAAICMKAILQDWVIGG